jgi:hypothetical protein
MPVRTSATYRLRVTPRPVVMRTPDGKWTVERLTTRGATVFGVRERAVIGPHGGAGRAPIGHICVTIDEVAGDDFADLA